MVSESLPSPQARGPRAFHSTDYIRLQQELIAVRTSFDRQIAQLTRLNRISNTLLSLQQGGMAFRSSRRPSPMCWIWPLVLSGS